jgi:hypothetical protein
VGVGVSAVNCGLKSEIPARLRRSGGQNPKSLPDCVIQAGEIRNPILLTVIVDLIRDGQIAI